MIIVIIIIVIIKIKLIIIIGKSLAHTRIKQAHSEELCVFREGLVA